MAAEIVAEFSAAEYHRRYVCVAPGRPCGPHITIGADGVWFRAGPESSMLQSAHRRCLEASR
ncbi:MAG: hypothetical protein WAV90_12810 [Gordonia amarae]